MQVPPLAHLGISPKSHDLVEYLDAFPCYISAIAKCWIWWIRRVLQDTWLILRFRRGSQEAFCRIYEKYRDNLLRLAVSLLKEKSVGEDIVHEVFAHLIESRHTFVLTGSLKAYLATCVANRARNANRDGRRGGTADSETVAARVSHAQRPDQWAVCSEEFERLRVALLRLSYEQREVVGLHIHGRMTFKEIAATQQVSIKTVQSRYRYALEKLRAMLDGEV
jgi:RNA polymerase sigma-70 factor, ECF subfamily